MADDDSKPPEDLDLNFHTDIPVGEILRRTRIHYDQTLDQIESVLRIRASQLEALEQGDISKLPGRVYAIGFVRSYSEYLGLDGDKMVYLFKEQSVGRKAKPDLSFPVPASESKVPNIFIIVGGLFGVVVLIGFIAFMMFPKSAKNEIPSVPEELTRSQLSDAPSLVGDSGAVNASDQQAAVPTDDAQKPKNRIVLEITDASWIEIKNAEGAAILRQVLKAGDIYLVPDEPGLVMATGNAGGITIKVDGQPIPKIGDSGEIRRKIALDPGTLTKRP